MKQNGREPLDQNRAQGIFMCCTECSPIHADSYRLSKLPNTWPELYCQLVAALVDQLMGKSKYLTLFIPLPCRVMCL
jgi:hypothetical protein